MEDSPRRSSEVVSDNVHSLERTASADQQRITVSRELEEVLFDCQIIKRTGLQLDATLPPRNICVVENVVGNGQVIRTCVAIDHTSAVSFEGKTVDCGIIRSRLNRIKTIMVDDTFGSAGHGIRVNTCISSEQIDRLVQ
ncbi:hypothetical protein HG66A1_19260 [Gimesia chilikensis]|uniref:Uncharacterized protein n=1 Tax=Gimesia chilikensis TaxID=2605989 RepID=A0A517PLB1_9PLAN|nr:hypothetical protein HG66A1_19260 [Gimesia chilikensis]QDT84149.1 hypothetical protein MalM14_18010 [Gimesia chilikensis]